MNDKIFKSIDIHKLSYFYKFTDEKEVSSFLFENTYLVDLLFELAKHLDIYFGSSRMYLSINKTGIIQDQLMVRIYNKNDPDENDRLLGMLDNGWWSRNIRRAQGKLVITA